MLRRLHSLPGLFAALLVAALAISGSVLAFDSLVQRAGTSIPPAGQVDVATLAAAAQGLHAEVERITRSASGAIIVHYFEDDRPGAELLDPVTLQAIGPHEPSRFTRIVTNLHRSFLMGDAGRAAAGIGALAMLLLCLTGAMLLARRLGGWAAMLRPMRGSFSQRWHGELGRFAVLGLLLSALTGCWMSLATFGVLPEGAPAGAAPSLEVDGGERIPVGELAALRGIDIAALRELSFPYGPDLTESYTLTTSQGIGQIDAATGSLLGFAPHDLAHRIHETIRMLHTGQGVWPLALLLGLAALTAPVMAVTGGVIWWRRRRALPGIRGNAPAQTADTIILVGSEGHASWGFAATLHAALTAAGHRVHTAAMNSLRADYAQARRMLILTATYGDGAAPDSAREFLARLAQGTRPLPVAVLGFGDRGFPRFCGFAEEVAAALDARGWPALLDLKRIDRQSAQDFARWGVALGEAIGTKLALAHVAARPKTVALTLAGRVDYGLDSQAPTAILRFTAKRLPRFVAGDLVGILPPGCNVPRFYSLASSWRDGVLEICVRKQPGGLCSGFLHELQPGARIAAFIRPNPEFRPARGQAPLILIGAGAGIAPLAGFIRQNRHHRPLHLYWGGRHPASDFLYEPELRSYVADHRLTGLHTAFSRVPGGGHVQDRMASDAVELRALVQRGAQVMVCGGREMAAGVARALEAILQPSGIDLARLRSEGRYLEDVY